MIARRMNRRLMSFESFGEKEGISLQLTIDPIASTTQTDEIGMFMHKDAKKEREKK